MISTPRYRLLKSGHPAGSISAGFCELAPELLRFIGLAVALAPYRPERLASPDNVRYNCPINLHNHNDRGTVRWGTERTVLRYAIC